MYNKWSAFKALTLINKHIDNWFKYDGGQVGTPWAVKYGDSKEQAYDNLKQLLVARGHEIAL